MGGPYRTMTKIAGYVVSASMKSSKDGGFPCSFLGSENWLTLPCGAGVGRSIRVGALRVKSYNRV